MPGRLFVVSTPIGDPTDLSPRARQILGSVGLIAAEDTRVTRGLLQAVGVDPPKLVSFHDHNEDQRAPQILSELASGQDVALVSDAGTPLVSDPGYRLVRAAVDAGVQLVPVPGPSALLAGLVISGLPVDRFTFVGFLPRQAGRRDAALQALAWRPETLVFYEAPHRVVETLEALEQNLGDRPACLAISLTKAWERCHRGPLSQVRAAIEGEGEIRGEMVLVVGGFAGNPLEAERARAEALIALLTRAGTPVGVVRDAVVQAFGWSRREAYQAALACRDAE